MSQQPKLKSIFDALSTRHGHVAITTAFIGALTDFLSPIGGWYVSTGIAALCATLLLLILANRNWVSEKIQRSQFLEQWIGGSLPRNTSYIEAPAVQYLAIGLLVFGYASYVTKVNADDGGALAVNFVQVSAFQSEMGILKKDLDVIKTDVAVIKDTVSATDRTTKTIDENVTIIKERLEMGAEAERDPAKQLQRMGTSWDLESFIKALDANDIKRLGLFMDGRFDYKSREAADRISSFFEPGKFSSHFTALSYLGSRGVDFVGEFNPDWDKKDDGSSSPLGRAALKGSEKAVKWLLEGANTSSLQKYKYLLAFMNTQFDGIIEHARKYSLDAGSSELNLWGREQMLGAIDMKVRIMNLLVSHGVDKSGEDYRLFREHLDTSLHFKYDHMRDIPPSCLGAYVVDELVAVDLGKQLKPLLTILAPFSQGKKSALEKAVMNEFVDGFNSCAISETEEDLKRLSEGRVTYLKSEAEKAEYERKQLSRIRDLKAKREAIRAELKV